MAGNLNGHNGYPSTKFDETEALAEIVVGRLTEEDITAINIAAGELVTEANANLAAGRPNDILTQRRVEFAQQFAGTITRVANSR